jgi:hypothetical protein
MKVTPKRGKTVIDTISTVFVLHYWTLSTGLSTDGPSGQTAPGVDRQLLKVTGSSLGYTVEVQWWYSGHRVPRLTEGPNGVVILQTVWGV